MPTITFAVDTDSPDVRLNIRKNNQLEPVNLNHGSGTKDYPASYVATAVLFFRGPVGTKARVKISQDVGGEQVVLALRNFIEITEPSGQATADIGFAVL
ncbi:MAG: hypothetical protein QOH81_192 [Sphingomonadales bacterium]|jgi:hypothetical protein|nr:hypothetical protein [Sphingomonadales bacterium]